MKVTNISFLRFFDIIAIIAACFMALTMFVCSAVAKSDEKPFNRITFVVDTSGSFTNKINEAIDKGKDIMDAIQAQQERRWEIPDEIYIISLDADPYVVWAGNRPQLDQLKSEQIAELVTSRKLYAHCTDVASAFNLAAEKFMRNLTPTGKYLFVFSDLIDEPPLPDGGCKPPKRPSAPPETIQWDKFQDVSITVFWPSDKEILAWEKALESQNLTITFYNEAESKNRQVTAPPKAQRQQSPEEIAQTQKRIMNYKNIAVKVFKWFIAVMLIGSIGLFSSARYFRNRRNRRISQRRTRTAS